MRVTLKERTPSLDLMWSAFLEHKGRGFESTPKTPTNLLSPYWPPNYGCLSRLEKAGAGIDTTYLINRYLSNDRGQFMSEDPVFWEIGLSKDGKQILADPQSANSYSYANDNPIIKKDPNGRWYVQIGINPTVGPYSAGYGFRINNQGVVFYYSSGVAAGLMMGGPLEFNTGDINTFKSDLSVSRDVTFAAGASVMGSYDGKVDTNSSLRIQDGKMNWGIGAGVGARVGQSYTQTVPVFRFSQSSYFYGTNTSQARTQAVQNYNSSSGATSNESKLWTTPNGAVVTWSGQVVVPGLKNNK